MLMNGDVMTIRYVLIAVNVSKALIKPLEDYVYMVDTTGYVGYNGEGGNELRTICRVGDKICWTVTSINPGNDILIKRITGNAVSGGVVNVNQPPPDGASTVMADVLKVTTDLASGQYTMELILDESTTKSFDPFLIVSPRLLEEESE